MDSEQKHWLDEDLEHYSIERLRELDARWHTYDEDDLWTVAYSVFNGEVPEDIHALPMLQRNELMYGASLGLC